MNTKNIITIRFVYAAICFVAMAALLNMGNAYGNQSNVGIQITKNQFDQKVTTCISWIENGSLQNTSIDEYIEIVRVYNTITLMTDYGNDDNYKKLIRIARTDVMKAAITALQARLTKGMAFYSSVHNLYIGGAPHANSEYSIQ